MNRIILATGVLVFGLPAYAQGQEKERATVTVDLWMLVRPGAWPSWVMISSVTEETIFALVAMRSSRLIPGLRAIPAVTTTMSESFESS